MHFIHYRHFMSLSLPFDHPSRYQLASFLPQHHNDVFDNDDGDADSIDNNNYDNTVHYHDYDDMTSGTISHTVPKSKCRERNLLALTPRITPSFPLGI